MRRTRRRTLKGAHSTKLSNLLNLKTEKIHCETKWERLYAHCSRHTIRQIQSMQSPAVAYYPPIANIREWWIWRAEYTYALCTQHYIPIYYIVPPLGIHFHPVICLRIHIMLISCCVRSPYRHRIRRLLLHAANFGEHFI